MTWDLSDKYLALSLLHDGELSPADRTLVEEQLALDADWRETYATLKATERRLSETLRRRAADPLGAAIEATLERYLRAHRLHPDAFPQKLVRTVFPDLTGAWFARILRAHRLEEKFVHRVSDAIRIASFQEPLDAQLREAFQAHRVGTAFLERVVGETKGQPGVEVDLPAAPVTPRAASGSSHRLAPERRTPPVGQSVSSRRAPGTATTAAVPPTPGRGSVARGSTPLRALTPARGQRRPSEVLQPETATAAAAAEKIRQLRLFQRYAPVLAAAVVLLVAGISYALVSTPPVAIGRQLPLTGSPLSAQVYSAEAPSIAGVQPVSVGGLDGYYPLDSLSTDHRTVSTGPSLGRLVAVTDPQTNVPIARVFLDAETTAQFYGPGEVVPGMGELARGGVVLERGSLLADVDKAGRIFEVLTPAPQVGGYNTVVVHGTRFYVHADADRAAVDVLEGLVRFLPATKPATPGTVLAGGDGARPPAIELPSGSRYSRNLADGTQRLQRVDPSEMTYRFAPAGLTISRWVQAGGGLERGYPTVTPFFEAYVPTEGPEMPADLILAGVPVVLPAGRGLALRRDGEQLRWCELPAPVSDGRRDARPDPRDIPGAAVVTGRLRGGPVLLPRQAVALVTDHTLQVFRTLDFHAAWQVELPASLDIHALSLGPRGMLILSTSQGLWAYDSATGAPLWRNQTLGEITSGIAATECADPAFLVAYDSIRARLTVLDTGGHVRQTIDLRATDTAAGLAQDLKDWTLYGTPLLAGNNCALVFEDGATAFVNLTTGARRMTAGEGLTERVRFATLERRDLTLTLVLQSGGGRQVHLAQALPPQTPVLSPAAAAVAGLAIGPRGAWTVDAAGHLRLWRPVHP